MENYEEKYKNALSQAKQVMNNIPDKSLAKWLQSIFPELQESDDEKMRAWLIEYFDKVNDEISKDDRKKIIAWLRKQSEQKPAWSEEDEQMLHEISQCVYDNVVNIGTVNKVKYIDWLKSLKERMKGE